MKLKKQTKSEKSLKKNSAEISESDFDRRQFLTKMAKIAIPTIAFLSLGNFSELISKPKKENLKPNPETQNEPNDCYLSCEGGCRTSCEGECRGTCEGLCYLTCEGSCKYTCEGGCNTTCEGCRGSCEGGCSGGAW